MIPINLRLENKLISKNLIAALAPLPRVLERYGEALQITARVHLAAKPARPRLDEFLSGRCPDRIRCLRRLLSC